jgi:hypothetical protein
MLRGFEIGSVEEGSLSGVGAILTKSRAKRVSLARVRASLLRHGDHDQPPSF